MSNGREIQRFSFSPRRPVSSRLHTGIERVETPAGRETDGELLGERVDRRRVLDGVERSFHSLDGTLPEPAVEEGTSRDRSRRGTAIGARRASRVARSSCRRASAKGFGARSRCPPLSAWANRAREPRAREQMISMSSFASPGGSSAFRTLCTRRSLLVTVPSHSAQAAAAGRTTSAISAVRVRKMSCTTIWSRPSRRWWARFASASDWAGFSPMT